MGMTPKSLGRIIADARIAQHRSQRELAADLGISGRELNDIERDRRIPSDEEIEGLAQMLHLERAVLYAGVRRDRGNWDREASMTEAERLAILRHRLGNLCTEALHHDRFDRVAIIVWRDDNHNSSSLVGNMASIDELRSVLAAIEANQSEAT